MEIQSMNTLESEIIRFFENPNEMHGLPEVVGKFRALADDASIKAALLKLSAEGVLEVTRDWEFHSATAFDSR